MYAIRSYYDQSGGAYACKRRSCAGERFQTASQIVRGNTVIRFDTIRLTALVGVLALVLQASPVRAEDESGASEAGLGAAAAISSLLYGPIKITYSTLGLVFGGFAWGLSGGDSEVLV